MKFLFRSLLVLAVAVAFGVVLYYAVQALPGGPTSSQQNMGTPPEGVKNTPANPASRSERPENKAGIRWRSVLRIARRVVVFSVLVLVAVLAKNFIFQRKPNKPG